MRGESAEIRRLHRSSKDEAREEGIRRVTEIGI